MRLELYDKCQNKCAKCALLQRKLCKPVSTEAALNALKNADSDSILLAGGDVMLRPDIELLLRACSRFKRKQVYTTARNLNHALLARYDFGAIVPFFGKDSKTHDEFTGCKHSFKEALVGMLALSRQGVRVTADYLLSAAAAPGLEAALKFFRARGAKGFLLTLPDALEPIFPYVKQAWEYAEQAGLELSFSNHQRQLSILLNHMFTGPIVTQFEITNACNHECVFCYHHSPHLLDEDAPYFRTHGFDKELAKRPPAWHRRRADFVALKSNARLAAESGCRYIQLGGGGEPTTHPDFMHMLEYIKGLGLQVQIFTNLTLLSSAKLKRIVELGVDVLEVNVSADNRETYRAVHSKDDFSKLVQSLKTLKALKQAKDTGLPQIRLMNPICSLNYREIPGMVEFAHANGASAVYLGHLQTTPQTSYLLLKPAEVNQANLLVKKASMLAKGYGLQTNFTHYLEVLNYTGTLEGSHTKRIFNRVGCLIPFYETQLHLDGTVAPCCLHPPIFKTRGRDFLGLWNAPEYKAFRQKALALYSKKEKPFLCRGCRMCVYQEDIQRFYAELGKLQRWLGQ
jgi:MoaA/NifB/PqqE/SkfB family radical SAM enzyme